MRNPGEDLEAEATEALLNFNRMSDAQAVLIDHLGACIVEWRRQRAAGMALAEGKTEKVRVIMMEAMAAEAEAAKTAAEENVRRGMEALRIARDRYGMVRTKMADRREEKGLILRDGGGHGA